MPSVSSYNIGLPGGPQVGDTFLVWVINNGAASAIFTAGTGGSGSKTVFSGILGYIILTFTSSSTYTLQ
jgi:hypothetical protein